MKTFNQTGRQSSAARWAIRPAAECVEVWFWLTIILFVSLLMSGAIMSAFEPRLSSGPLRQQLLVQLAE
jgi:cytochrome b subunit of formate dehydrogenase